MLPKRLLVCAEQIRHQAKVCDVGTDHALLPCYLVEEGIAKQVIASDVNEKPLAGAQKLVEKRGLSGKVTTRLSDGLKQILSEEADDIVVAGMGGELIARILLDCSWAKDAAKRFVLQPMTQTPYLRQTLWENGFVIEEETAVSENGHVYTVLRVHYTGETTPFTEADCWAGCHRFHPVGESADYLAHQAKRLEKMVIGMEKAAAPEAAQTRRLMEELLQVLEEKA